MKKNLFAFFTVLACICVSCNNEKAETKESSAAQKNLDASHIVTKAFETGDVSAIDSAVASDFVDHTERGDKNRDSLKTMISMMHNNTKDVKAEVLKELADDDYVMSWMKFTGTSDGSMGMPKGPFEMQAIEMEKFKDGKAVEHWEFMTMQEMMKMMPQMPMDNKMMADSSKMKK